MRFRMSKFYLNWVTNLAKRYGNETNAIPKIIGTIPTGLRGIGKEEEVENEHEDNQTSDEIDKEENMR